MGVDSVGEAEHGVYRESQINGDQTRDDESGFPGIFMGIMLAAALQN